MDKTRTDEGSRAALAGALDSVAGQFATYSSNLAASEKDLDELARRTGKLPEVSGGVGAFIVGSVIGNWMSTGTSPEDIKDGLTALVDLCAVQLAIESEMAAPAFSMAAALMSPIAGASAAAGPPSGEAPGPLPSPLPGDEPA